MTQRRAAALLALSLLAPSATLLADDCDTLAAARDAVTQARDDVDAARAAVDAAGDVAGALALCHDDATAADVQIAAAASPDPLLTRQKKIHKRLAAALRAVVRAQKHPASARRARLLLRDAGRALDKASALLAAATDETGGCGPVDPGGADPVLNGALGATQVFPSDNWWNEDVSARPVASNSDAVIDFIGRTTKFHADFGTDFGIPFVVLDKPQPLTPLTFLYDDQSDHAAPGQPLGYPIPAAAKSTAGWIEGGVAGGGSSGDRHLLLVDRRANLLYEIYAARWNGSAWSAGSGAIFDLTSNARRPDTWTSADAAGLAIFPGLVRAAEVLDAGEVRHAFRFTVRATQGYVYPASHDATHGAGGASRPPLGLRVRMKASVDLSGLSQPARVIFTAMKKYGLILADNGSDWYVTGAPDPRWDDGQMHDDFAKITGNDFEVVQ